MKNDHTDWLTPCEYKNEEPELFQFKKEIIRLQNEQKETYLIQVSADSCYKLFVNDVFVEVSPAKGDHLVWFYDEIDLAPYLTKEKNIVTVEVLHYPMEHWKGKCGIFRTELPGLYFKELRLAQEAIFNFFSILITCSFS